MEKKLSAFLLKKQTHPQSHTGIDWDERRETYLAAVSRLYSQIETIFAEPIAQNTVALQRRPKQLTENYIGAYSVDDLILIIGDEQVRFSPSGRHGTPSGRSLTAQCAPTGHDMRQQQQR